MSDDQSQKPIEEQPPNSLPDTTLVETQPDPAKGVPFRVQMLLGFGTFYGLIASTAGVKIAVAARSPWVILPSVMLIALGVFTKRRLRSRGFVIGALIGLGLLVLGWGFCIGVIQGI